MDQPKRKSLAGPMLLAAAQPTHEVATGPTKKTEQDAEAVKGPVETGGFKKSKGPKDTTTIEGRAIIIGSAECTGDQLCCQYNEDFTMYAGGGVDGNLKIFNSESNDILMTLSDSEVQGRTASVTCVKHRPVTKNYPINNCYTCTYVNGLVKCWNYNFKQCIYTIRENRQTYGLAYHPRLPKFITYGDNMKIYLYDEETKVQERVLQASDRKEAHDGPISRVFAGRFNPRSNYEFLTGGWDDLVHLWDLRAPHAVKHISGVHLCGEGLDINKRGTEILTCSWRKEEQLQLWDYASFKSISTFYPDVHACKLYCGRFMNSDFLCCCGGDPALLRVVDLQTSYSAVIVHSLPSAVYHLNVGPTKPPKTNKPQVEEDARQKADISRVPKLCYTCGRKLVQLDFIYLDISCGQLCCHYNEDFSLFAAGGVDGILRLYETTNFNLVRMISGGSDTKGCTACVTCIKHKPVVNPESIDHQFTISYVNGIVKCLNYNTKECKFTIKERRQTYGLSFHPRMPKFITYGDDLKINLYDHETQKKERTFKGSGEFHKNDGHTSRVFAAKFNPASNAEFLSGGWDNTVFLWDLRQPRAARFISDVHLCGEGLDIDKMGRQVLTCSWRKADQLQLWDYSTFKLISPIIPDPFESKLYCGRFLGSDFIACGGSDPSLFRVVDMLKKQSRVVISNLPSDVFHVNVGKYRYAWNNLTSSVKKNKSNSPEDLTKAPSVLFTAGGRIYTVDFNK